jgi:hypothetical protein
MIENEKNNDWKKSSKIREIKEDISNES